MGDFIKNNALHLFGLLISIAAFYAQFLVMEAKVEYLIKKNNDIEDDLKEIKREINVEIEETSDELEERLEIEIQTIENRLEKKSKLIKENSSLIHKLELNK